MLIESVKTKIACEILSQYVASLPACSSMNDLLTPTLKMVYSVVGLAIPNHSVNIKLNDLTSASP